MSLFLYLMTGHTPIHTQIRIHCPHTQQGVPPEQSRSWVRRCQSRCRSSCWDTSQELLQSSHQQSVCSRCLQLASPGSIQTPALELPEPQWQGEQVGEGRRRRSSQSRSSPSLVRPRSEVLAIQFCLYAPDGQVTSDRVIWLITKDV